MNKIVKLQSLQNYLHFIRKHWVLILTLCSGFFLQMSTIMPSGSYVCLSGKCGYHFWGVHGFDGMWHLAIAASSFGHSSIRVPTFSGSTLSGYNILMDYSIFLISKLGIPPWVTLFKIIPLLTFVLLSTILILFFRVYKPFQKSWHLPLFLCCMFFAGHAGYFLQLYHKHSFFLGSQSFSLQQLTMYLNTQFAISLPLLMVIFLIIAKRSYTLKSTLCIACLTSLMFGLKFYGGVIALFATCMYLIDFYLVHRSVKEVFFHGVCIGIVVLLTIFIVYDPLHAQTAGKIFSFSPFALVHSVIEEKDMVYLKDMVNARYYLYANGGMGPRLLAIELLSLILYVSINFGTRVFALVYVAVRIISKKATRIELYLFLTIICSLVLSISLIQRGDWWNTVQFSYYGIFLSTIFLADMLIALFSSSRVFYNLIGVALILLSLPSNATIIKSFISTNTSYIPKEELSALAFLKKLPDGVVFNAFDTKKNIAYPFLTYENTGYISAFTGKQLYVGHVGPLTIIGVDYKPRLARVRNKDCAVFKEVDYIYITKWQDRSYLKRCKIPLKSFKPIFQDATSSILSNKRRLESF